MKHLQRFSPILFLGLLTCIVFYKIIFLGQTYYDGFDNLYYIAPAKAFLVDQIRHGIFPLWNPYLFLGVPFFADITVGTLSIFTLPFFIFSSAHGIALVSFFAIFLIGVFQYYYLRFMKLSKVSSLFGAIVFAFAGTIFISTYAIDFLTVVLYIPIIFLLLHFTVIKKRYVYFLLLILFQAFQMVTGHIRITYYTMLFVSLYLIFWSNFTWKKKTVLLLLYYLGLFALAAVQLIPFVEYVLFSTRPLSSLAFASSGSLALIHAVTFFFPTFFGTHAAGTWWGPQLTLFGYMSIPAYVLLYIGMVKRTKIKKSFYIIGLFLSLLLAVGKISPVYILFYYIVPGWSSFRNPIDIMVFFTFFASVLCGIGLDYVLQKQTILKNISKKFFYFLSIILIPTVVIYFTIFSHKNFWNNFLSSISHYVHITQINRLLIYDNVKLQVMFQGMTENVILFLLFCLVSIFVFTYLRKSKRLLGLSLIAITSFSLLYFDSTYITTAPSSFVNANLPVPSVLNTTHTGEYRMLSLPVNLHQHREHLAIPDFFYIESIARLTTYAGDTNMENQLYQVSGAMPLIPNTYAHFILGDNVSADVTGIDFSRVTQEQLNLSSVKYIVSLEPIASFPAQLMLREANPEKQYIYENPYARKRAYLLNDPLGKNIVISEKNPNTLTIQAVSSENTQLIITDWYYPGWQAVVNGKKTSIKKYLNTFQMISLPKGKSVVQLVYQPISFFIGLWISAVSLSVYIVLFIFFKKNNAKI